MHSTYSKVLTFVDIPLDLDEDGKEGILDIPPEYRSLKNYCATLAHKTNHSFDPNAKFVLFDHPKLGKVPGIQTLEEIKTDEEITVSYDYALEDAPPWYQDLYSLRVINIYQKVKSYDFESELKNKTSATL